MMSHQRQNSNNVREFGDTTYTKIFVGGLAWETQRDTMKLYFDQFGEILEAVVITDRISGKSKGYGFVTFKDPESATRACEDPNPVIDGRRTNCNLAYLGGAKKNPPIVVPHHAMGGMEKTRQPTTPMAASPVHGSSFKFFRQPVPQYAFSYPAYGYPTYSQHTDAMNYHNAYYGQSRFPGVYPNYYPVYAQHQQSSVNQYPKMVHYPYMPHQYRGVGILSLPPPSIKATTAGPATVGGILPETDSEQNSSVENQ